MKFRTTRKAIVNGTPTNKLFQCGYCDMAHLLNYHSPIAYTCGVYGWNFDVYIVNGLTITTGYRNCCGKWINYELLREYENRAKAVFRNDETYGKREKLVEEILSEFCKKLQEGA